MIGAVKPNEDRHHDDERLSDVRRQHEKHSLLDVVVDRAPFLYGGGDRGEVVVGQHHLGRLFGNLGALDSHCDANIGFLEGRRIVHAVAGHRHDLLVRLDRLDETELVLRAGAREDVDVADPLLQCRGIHFLDLCPGDCGSSVADAEHLGDRGRGDLVVPGDHRDADAAGMAFRHGFYRLRPRRIEQPDEAEQNQVLREIRRAEVAGIDSRILEPRKGQHALALRRQLVRRVCETAAVDRLRLPTAARLSVAMIEDHLRRPLDQQKLSSRSIFVQRRHEPVFRLERDHVNPGIGGLLGLPFETELVAKRVESALGRVAFDLPGALFLVDLGIVAEHRDAPHQPENRILPAGTPPFSTSPSGA